MTQNSQETDEKNEISPKVKEEEEEAEEKQDRDASTGKGNDGTYTNTTAGAPTASETEVHQDHHESRSSEDQAVADDVPKAKGFIRGLRFNRSPPQEKVQAMRNANVARSANKNRSTASANAIRYALEEDKDNHHQTSEIGQPGQGETDLRRDTPGRRYNTSLPGAFPVGNSSNNNSNAIAEIAEEEDLEAAAPTTTQLLEEDSSSGLVHATRVEEDGQMQEALEVLDHSETIEENRKWEKLCLCFLFSIVCLLLGFGIGYRRGVIMSAYT